jgi:septal ring factor EnvC (AmiA/AmiB activator)
MSLGVIVLALALLGFTYAQEKSDDRTLAEVRGQLPAFYKKLGLSKDQVHKILKIRADSKKKVADLQRQIDQVKAAERTELEKVLTPQQLKRLKELRTGEISPPEKPK